MKYKLAYYVVAIVLTIAVVWVGPFFFPKSEEEGVEPATYATTGWEQWASPYTALTAALYWEGDLRESEEGLRAIAWVILNRVKSRDFPRDKTRPNTIRGVVTDGYRRAGCQFSFACNGAGESFVEFQRLQARMGVMMTLEEAEKRWMRYSQIAWKFLANPGTDPTRGANHYWAASMTTDPDWVKTDIDPSSKIKIGSHWFGWSRFLGEDVPRL